jgi:ADP-ribosyl-[dinitrogen reductase] hydrolase
LPGSAVRDRIQALLPLRLSVVDVASLYGATGHVVDTVPLALYCAQAIVTEGLPVVLERTITIGGDTDTIASITGQVAGTVAGAAGIPDELIAEIKGDGELRAISGEFAEFVVRSSFKANNYAS